MKHFQFYPRIEYTDNLAINMSVRSKIRNLVLSNDALYYEYTLKDGERADTLSMKYYGSPDYTWAIFYANDIINPLTDWPYDYRSFNNFIRRKYGSVERAKTTVQHYLLDDEFIIDEKTYLDNTIDFDRKKIVSIYDYETEINDEKRDIKVLDLRYLRQVTEELRTIFKD